jgi:hypothetical protein
MRCVLFKCFDTAPDRAKFCLHTSFVAPPPADAGGGGGSHRQSIEARAGLSPIASSGNPPPNMFGTLLYRR